jgi:iron(III) transport system ATP-binding protein
MAELAFHGVTKRFADGTCAVRDLSFTLSPGRLTTVLGPSGSGKSTLLRMAAGLDRPSAGRVFIGGRDVTDQDAEDRNVCLLFQNDALFPHLDVLCNVSFGLTASGLDERSARRRATAVLELVGLGGFGHRPVGELSGGQGHRVALARSLALQPQVLLLDEPLSNLDDRLRRQMRDEIRALQQRLQLTMAYVTHDEREAMALSDHVAVMNEGRLLQMGTPRTVYEQPNCEFVAAFMGDASIIDVSLDADGRIVAGAGGQWRLNLPLEVPAGARCLRLMVRPEAWRLLPVGGGPGLPGRILRCAYLGRCSEYTVDTDIGEIFVSTHHAEALHQPGAPVTLALERRGVTVLNSRADGPLITEPRAADARALDLFAPAGLATPPGVSRAAAPGPEPVRPQ